MFLSYFRLLELSKAPGTWKDRHALEKEKSLHHCTTTCNVCVSAKKPPIFLLTTLNHQRVDEFNNLHHHILLLQGTAYPNSLLDRPEGLSARLLPTCRTHPTSGPHDVPCLHHRSSTTWLNSPHFALALSSPSSGLCQQFHSLSGRHSIPCSLIKTAPPYLSSATSSI